MNDIDVLEDDLMNVEMKMQDTLHIATTDFEDRVKKLIEEMKIKTGNL